MAKIIKVHETKPNSKPVDSRIRLLSIVLAKIYALCRGYSTLADDEIFSSEVSRYVKLGFLTAGEANTLIFAKKQLDKILEKAIENGEYKTPLVVLAKKALLQITRGDE